MSGKDEESRDSTRPTEGPYKVGYGKPPSTFQFKKGVSGNPKGRPPGRGKTIRAALKEAPPKVPPSPSHKIAEKSEAPATSPGEPRDKWSANVTDEELLQMVKARKLTWQALFDIYLDEKRARARKEKTPKRGGPAEQ
jgi:hypothetical protein